MAKLFFPYLILFICFVFESHYAIPKYLLFAEEIRLQDHDDVVQPLLE